VLSRGGNLIRNYIKIAGLLVTALAVTGCGPSSGANSPAPGTIAKTSSNVLQLAVGTANLYGGTAAAATGLNVVSTYRQGTGNTAPGDSGAAVDSPTLTIPNTLPVAAGIADGGDATIATGPSSAEADTGAMTSTAQTGSNDTTFGFEGQVSGLGIEPFNYNQLGTPDGSAPYPIPVYDALAATAAGDPNQIPAAWGGPPAFDILKDGESPIGNGDVPAGTAGISTGLDVFEGVSPVAGGTYSLSVSLPANTGTVAKGVSFSLPGALTVLPNFTPPVPTADASGDGGATFAVTLPAGVSEAYIEVLDVGPGPYGASGTESASCNSAGDGQPNASGGANDSPVYYTIEVTASGTATLGPAAGPGGAPSLCNADANTAANSAATGGDAFIVEGIGFDYPAYESSYPNSSGNPSPTILGANGSDDVTISAGNCVVVTGGAGTTATTPCPAVISPLIHARHHANVHVGSGKAIIRRR
jgi:hypothetical protein